MQNIIFIERKTYKDTLVGPQLLHLLDRTVYFDGKWGCYTDKEEINEVEYNMILDNIVYVVNNALLTKQFDNIVVGWEFQNLGVIEDIISHLDSDNAQISVFELTTTEGIEVENFELMNKEYKSNYYMLQSTGQLVKISSIDTTEISAFKIAHIISQIITR